ncbi:beta-L-arabinofuranosidase domain-containing protein [Streptomyces sp. MA15]|uniref:beta-L-arabinofuranosidase domain-containing protein n=1 Tax=Streptomyces sp. MA15 TaxID=3055061 RepID=UPI0025AFB634|nr:beta-L-arabinofuranosidase domain-containing protein [Streptomyces sp. MA15]MDN3270162.1 glycoside hydrolase family 127 protein [Streptomyces sp. MA15]
MSPHLNRRQILQSATGVALAVGLTGYGTVGNAAAAAPTALGAAAAVDQIGVKAHPFAPGRVLLKGGRWLENMNRTLAYLRFVDVDRLLYNYRANHGLDTKGAEPLGGFEAPNGGFRSSVQGSFLTAWAQARAETGESVFRDKAVYMVAELAKCQAADDGFHEGFLAGFPESDLDIVEQGHFHGIPYWCLFKALTGLIDAWQIMGIDQARDVALALAGWVDWRTGRLSYEEMQVCMRVEFGGINYVLTHLYLITGDQRWLTVAQRFDHAAVMDPLAAGQDKLAGLHGNTQIQKCTGYVLEYKATGTQRYLDIGRNFWNIVTEDHTYVIGANTNFEGLGQPDTLASRLGRATGENCNTYNMLKLTRELFSLEPERVAYADFYERAVLNQMLAQQNEHSEHGYINYHSSLMPGTTRNAGQPGYWNDGVNWGTDYDTTWCCEATGWETQTGFTKAIYFHDDAGLWVNLFIPSTLDWSERGVTVTQTTEYPASDTTTLKINGTGGEWTLRVRIPGWTKNATISVNGQQQNVATKPGSYATLTRTWADGDTVTVTLPMSLRMQPIDGDERIQAVAYGPVVLSGAYGDDNLANELPALEPDTIKPTSTPLTFTARANGAPVTLIPYYNNDQNMTVYWDLGQPLPAGIHTGAIIYTHADWTDPSVALPLGNYTAADLSAAGLATYSITGIRPLGPCQVIGYTEDNFQGESWTFTDDEPDLRNSGRDNAIVSLRVTLNPHTHLRLANVATGLSLGSGGREHGADLRQRYYWHTDHELHWRAEERDDGTYRLVSRVNGWVADSWGTHGNGAPVRQGEWDTEVSQRWEIIHVRGDAYRLINRHTGLALDGGGHDSNGASAQQWTWNGSTNLQWKFITGR